jgi:DNA-binding beta-propeller fold protein YncE
MHLRSLSPILISFLVSFVPLFGVGSTWEALVTRFYGNNVTPFSVPSDIVGSSVSVGDSPTSVAITPDGTRALVSNWDDGTVTVLDLTQPIIGPGYTVPAGREATAIAITPDGSLALVANTSDHTVTVLDLTQSIVGPGYTVHVGRAPVSVAITPDGTQALVSNYQDATVSVLGLTSPVQVQYTISVGRYPNWIAITPDGTKALVPLSGENVVRVLDLTQSTIGPGYTVPVGQWPLTAAVTPDGTKALVANNNENTISVLDMTQSTITQGYSVTGSLYPGQFAITPDGTRAYVTYWFEDTVGILDLTHTPITPLPTPILLSGVPSNIAITPDQAPTSLFATSVHGLTVIFDGSGSSSPVGNVREYIWSFGDGSDPVTTTSSTVSHTYARSGAYTVSLTVVNDAGTSLEVTFTGQMVSNRGLPRARSTQTITLDPLAPASFTGKVHLDTGNKQVLLKTRWQPSTDMNTWRYEIFAYGAKIAVVDASAGDHIAIELHPHHFPRKISDTYRRYLGNKYAIRSVTTDGVASALVPLQVGR